MNRLSSHRNVRPATAGRARLATGAPAASSRSTGSGSGLSTTLTDGPDVPAMRSAEDADADDDSADAAAAASSPARSTALDAAAPSDATSSGPCAAAAAPRSRAPPPDADAVGGTAVARQHLGLEAVDELAEQLGRHVGHHAPAELGDLAGDGEVGATLTAVPSPSGVSVAVIVALALPWPRVSRPSARARPGAPSSSRSTNVAVPLYCAVIGPDLDLHDAAVLVALDLLELGAGHARGDPLDVGEHRPRLARPARPPGTRWSAPSVLQVLHACRLSMSAARPGTVPPSPARAGRRISTRAPSSPAVGSSGHTSAPGAPGCRRSAVVGGHGDGRGRRPARPRRHASVGTSGWSPRPTTTASWPSLAGPGRRRPAATWPCPPPTGRCGRTCTAPAAAGTGRSTAPRTTIGGVEPGRGGRLDRPRDHRPPPERRQQLVASPPEREPRPAAGGEHDGGRRHRGSGVPVDRARRRRAGAGPARPVRRAMISAQIDTAVSSGVRAPMSRPMGAMMRAEVGVGRRPPRASRASAVVVGAAAAHRPEVADVGGERGHDGGHVELGVVGEHAHRVAAGRASAPTRSSSRWGQSTTTSSASGKRCAGGEHLAGVAHGDAVAEHLGHPDERGGEVDGAEDEHPRRRGEATR